MKSEKSGSAPQSPREGPSPALREGSFRLTCLLIACLLTALAATQALQARNQPQAIQLHIVVDIKGSAKALAEQQRRQGAAQPGGGHPAQAPLLARKQLRVTALEEEMWGSKDRPAMEAASEVTAAQRLAGAAEALRQVLPQLRRSGAQQQQGGEVVVDITL